ncbi:MAG: MerR family transcriptional regulator [Micromonosporaceae bacterium]|nr:MerR family transcriptional regulator [Micromonosporaceae bacterium]
MNLTLSVADDVVERARAAARQQGTSLNALVRRYLESLAGGGRGEDLAGQFDALWRERSGRSGGWRFNRDELYEDRLGPGRQ